MHTNRLRSYKNADTELISLRPRNSGFQWGKLADHLTIFWGCFNVIGPTSPGFGFFHLLIWASRVVGRRTACQCRRDIRDGLIPWVKISWGTAITHYTSYTGEFYLRGAFLGKLQFSKSKELGLDCRHFHLFKQFDLLSSSLRLSICLTVGPFFCHPHCLTWILLGFSCVIWVCTESGCLLVKGPRYVGRAYLQTLRIGTTAESVFSSSPGLNPLG